ncbi:DUF5335 domain-containing protein [Rhizobium sp. BK176]|uniref:DUF5335 domain-containing protein n=1 Tax=Rhizobium sp. BK176 TaxID=2587071 RepID=UPI0021685705|nr:DUF5335 domain-containing protein [Rhizobium sp. BK176]MCS4093677.1 hypothetical protein [Rhizobium sp. BK176]
MGGIGWRDPIMVTLGTVIFASPWVLPSSFGDPLAGDATAWALVLTGAVTTGTAVVGIVLPERWEALIEFALGGWVIILPWVMLPLHESTAVTWAAVIIGSIIIVISAFPAFAEAEPKRRSEMVMINHGSRTTEALLSAAGWLSKGDDRVGVRVLPKSDWSAYFSELHKEVEGKEIKIEVIGETLGDQVLIRSSTLIGATYEPKEDALEISVKGMTHVVDRPQKISVLDENGTVCAIDVIDIGARHQLMTFA